jgi:hypothetical protein
MAEQSFPFENTDTTEDQFSQWASNFQDTGVQGSPTGTELKVTAEGSELIVNVALGQAFIRGHYYISTDTVALTVAGAGVNTRIDYVVIELDPAANTIAAKLVSGTAVSENPVAPTLTQSATGVYQLPVALLTIPSSTLAITNEMLTDVRVFMANRVGIWTTATRPAVPTDYQTLGYNTTTGSHEVWNGSDWVGFMEPISTAGDLIIGDVTGQAARLPIGVDDQVLTVVSGLPVWLAGATGPISFQVMPATLSIYDYPFDLNKTYGFVYYGTGLTVGIYDANDEELSVLPAGDSVQYLLEQPAGAARLFMSTTSQLPAQISFFEIVPTTAESTASVFYIDSTQSVTLDFDYTAYLIGGGGNGGNGSGGGGSDQAGGGGGGGAGYIASGVISAGTYTATVGSSGGTTSIGSLTAAGGSNGGGGGIGNPGQGGNGGSGGGSGNTSFNVTSAGGFDGGDGEGPNFGTGSGNALVDSLFSKLLNYGPPDGAGTGAAGFYKGGKGGVSYPNDTPGIAAAAFGGGGGGGTGDRRTYGTGSVPGGSGYQGLIVLVEVA